MGCLKKVKKGPLFKRFKVPLDIEQLDMFQEDMLNNSFNRRYCDGISSKKVRSFSESEDVFESCSIYSPDERS